MPALQVNVIDLSSRDVESFIESILKSLSIHQNIVKLPSKVIPLPSMRIHPKHKYLYSQCNGVMAKENSEIANVTTKILFLQNNNISILSNKSVNISINWTHLIHLNLSFNKLSTLPNHDHFWRYFPKLTVLLLHDNKLNSLSNIIESLQFIAPQIEVLTIQNNPFCRSSNYQPQIFRIMPNLLLLNDHIVSEAEVLGVHKDGNDQTSNIDIDLTKFKFISYHKDYNAHQHISLLDQQLNKLKNQQKSVRFQMTWSCDNS